MPTRQTTRRFLALYPDSRGSKIPDLGSCAPSSFTDKLEEVLLKCEAIIACGENYRVRYGEQTPRLVIGVDHMDHDEEDGLSLYCWFHLGSKKDVPKVQEAVDELLSRLFPQVDPLTALLVERLKWDRCYLIDALLSVEPSRSKVAKDVLIRLGVC
jgi:hypothetical protein